MGHAGRLDDPDLLELHLRAPEVVEDASTVAEVRVRVGTFGDESQSRLILDKIAARLQVLLTG